MSRAQNWIAHYITKQDATEHFMLPTEYSTPSVFSWQQKTAKKIISSHNREQHTTVKYSTFYCLLSTFGFCTKIQADQFRRTEQRMTAQNITLQHSVTNLFECLRKQKL